MINRLLPVLLLAAVPSLAAPQVIVDTSKGQTITIRVVTPPPAPLDTPLVAELRPGHPLLQELTKKTLRVSWDTLWFYSRIDAPAWPFAGQALDTAFESLFAPFYPGLHFPHDEPQLFAARRFVLDPQHVAYLLRVPGMYESTALDLWIFDARSRRFAVPERLAESWGDEGCGYNLEALLTRSTIGGRLQLLVYKNTGCSDIETGKVLSSADSLWVRPWTGDAFAPGRLTTDSTLFVLFRREWERLRR